MTTPPKSRKVSLGGKDATRARIERIEAEREERRRQLTERKNSDKVELEEDENDGPVNERFNTNGREGDEEVVKSRKISIGGKSGTRLRIERMEAERQERRRLMEERKLEKAEEEQRLIAEGNPADVDFVGLVRKWREEHGEEIMPYESTKENPKICICVRKRPINDKERKRRDHDSVTSLHPCIWVHSAKLKVDGITKYLDHTSFCFDYSFDENSTTEDVYQRSTMPLVQFLCKGKGGRATVFAYGQTGSGKTFTMSGIQQMVANDIFQLMSDEYGSIIDDDGVGGCSLDNSSITVSFFEIYAGCVQDLLNKRCKLKVLEDGKGEVVITGLKEFEVKNPNHLLEMIEVANRRRATHATEANDESSRSHAICQINIRDKDDGTLRGKMSLVDLAGSERGSDTKSHNRQRRTESSEINTSLLALKECIRALDSGRGTSKHVPYRASKLTLILKDCFTSNLARTSMIATVSPGASSADHSLNTLRYADRIKEKKAQGNVMTKQRQESKQQDSDENQVFDENVDDLDILHNSLRGQCSEDYLCSSGEEDNQVTELRRTVQNLFEAEESLLSLHMSVIQENAELLTEEGKLLQGVQRDEVLDYDIDHYASRVASILDRKTYLISMLKEKVMMFRSQLEREEELSKKIASMPSY